MSIADLARQITGRPLTAANLAWIQQTIPNASPPMARLLCLILVCEILRARRASGNRGTLPATART